MNGVPQGIVYIMSLFPCYSETFILNELIELRARGHDVSIFSLYSLQEKIVQHEARDFLKDTFYSPFFFSVNLWRANLFFLSRRLSSYAGALFDIIRHSARRPEVLLKNLSIFPKSVYFAFTLRSKQVRHIHAHFASYPATSAFIVSGLLGVPFSFTCHAHDIFYDSTMLGLKIERSKACVVISEYNKSYIAEKFPHAGEKIVVLHCGIPLDDFPAVRSEGRHEGPVRILSVGRLMPTKGYDDLIRACSILKEKGVAFQCDIVGEGPMEGTLKGLIGALGLSRDVRLVGPLSRGEIIDLYGRSDLVVVASKRAKHRDVQDGIPVVLMEAMASRIPVISTRFSGIPELIVDGVSGLLVNTGDHAAIAEKIMLIKDNPELAQMLALNAYRTVASGFNITTGVDMLETIFYA